MDINELRNYCIDMYANGNTISKIARDIGKSRTYVTNLIKYDKRYIFLKYNRKIKVYKRNSNNQMMIYIPTEFIKKIGITNNKNIDDFVNVFYDEKNNQIIINKA